MHVYKYLPSYFISHIPFESQCPMHIQYYLIKRKEKEIKYSTAMDCLCHKLHSANNSTNTCNIPTVQNASESP